ASRGALCTLHHKIFDRGAYTVPQDGVLLVSDQAHGTTGFSEALMCHHGKPVRGPQRREGRPAPVGLEWHTREVFKGAVREGLGRSGWVWNRTPPPPASRSRHHRSKAPVRPRPFQPLHAASDHVYSLKCFC